MLKTAGKHALAYLQATIERFSCSNRQKLPSLATLASQAGVAENTMHKAVQLLKERGIIRADHRHGIRIVSLCQGETGDGGEPRGTRSERLVLQLTEDIIGGKFPPRSLPGSKELCTSYGVCYSTMKKALDNLVHGGVLVRYGRQYRLKTVPVSTRSNVLVLIFRGMGMDIVTMSDMQYHFIKELELLCSERGVEILPVFIYYTGTQLQGIEGLGDILKKKNKHVLGFHLLTEGIEYRYLLTILGTLAPFDKPVTVMDMGEMGGDHIDRRNVRVYSPLVGKTPGKRMANYLLANGHTRIAYFDLPDAIIWSVNRFQGMLDQARFHRKFHVERFVAENYSHPTVQMFEMETAMMEQYEKMLSSGSRLIYRQTVHPIVTLNRQYFDLQALYHALQNAIGDNLQSGRFSAIAGANDEIAVCCLDICRKAGLKVPEDIAIAGFDDSRTAMMTGLTSYRFNIPGIAHRMVNFVLNPHDLEKHDRYSDNGLVVVRSSTLK
jgi:DNA-binding transcriptional regulator YhcF (GntR family)